MSLILVTGATGGGKTALVVDWLGFDAEFRNRPLFVMGIPELKLDHEAVPPLEEWTELRPSPEDPKLLLPYFTFPAGSVIVLDEAQRVYRPRNSTSKVPDYVAAFETHRHTGVDFILITQHPGLLDANVRKLVRRHIHIHETPFNRYRLEWPKLGDIESPRDRELAARSPYAPPKRAFPLYKSAEVHTVLKRKIPKSVWLMAVGLVVCSGFGVYGYQRIKAGMGPKPMEVDGSKPSGGGVVGGHPKGGPLSTAEYLDQQVPRVPGFLHTAPVYDEVTKVKDAPWPVGCWTARGSCKCVDQQGNAYAMPAPLCQQVVEKGLFKAWGHSDEGRQVGPVGQAVVMGPARGSGVIQAPPPSAPLSEMPSQGSGGVGAGSGSVPRVPESSQWRVNPSG